MIVNQPDIIHSVKPQPRMAGLPENSPQTVSIYDKDTEFI